jgi:hypothetical protein
MPDGMNGLERAHKVRVSAAAFGAGPSPDIR